MTQKDPRDTDPGEPQPAAGDAEQPIVIRINEPVDTAGGKALRRVGTGPKAPPFVLDDGEHLQLHFTMRYTQSRMNLKAPFALSLDYTRKMMACLLFQPDPMHIEIVGLGGGSLTKFCYRQLPHTRVTTIEVDQSVIAMAHMFRVPKPNSRLAIVHADAADYFAQPAKGSDVVLVDGCDTYGIAPSLSTRAFYRSVRERLRPRGVLAVNLVGTARMKDAVQQIIADVFEDRVLVLNVAVGSNRIALAFRDTPWPPDWPAIKANASRLAQQHGLELEEYADTLERWQRNRLRKSLR